VRRPASQKTRKDTGGNLLLAPKTQVEDELLFPEVIDQEQIPEYDWAVLVTKRLFEQISSFLNRIISTAAQLNPVRKWTLILARAFKVFLRGRAICPGSEGYQILLPMRL
jgi:hypothetical protein